MNGRSKTGGTRAELPNGVARVLLAGAVTVAMLPCWGCLSSQGVYSTSSHREVRRDARVQVETESGEVSEGRFVRQLPDSLWILDGSAIRGFQRSDILRLEVHVDRATTTIGRVLAGTVVGTLTGLILARRERRHCTSSVVEGFGMFNVETTCTGRNFVSSAPQMFAAGGAMIGLVVGLTRPRWKAVYGPERIEP